MKDTNKINYFSLLRCNVMMNLSGRLTPLNYFKNNTEDFTINIGSQSGSFADINSDITEHPNLDVLSSVLNIPFRQETFSKVYFTEVLEHLPKNSESVALSEICLILKKDGLLILSTPNDFGPWKYLDPAFYLVGHRHYKKEKLSQLIEAAGFKTQVIFTGGGFWEILGNLLYSFILYPLKRILGSKRVPSAFPLIDKQSSREFRFIKDDGGSGLFAICRK